MANNKNKYKPIMSYDEPRDPYGAFAETNPKAEDAEPKRADKINEQPASCSSSFFLV